VTEPRYYRPAWFLRLFVRLEDFGQTDDSSAQDGEKPYKNAQAKAAADRAVVEAQIAQEAAGRVTGASRSQAAMVGLSALAKSLQRQAATAGKDSAAGPQGKGDEFSVSFVTVPLTPTPLIVATTTSPLAGYTGPVPLSSPVKMMFVTP